jgi:trimethylamine--corrinoid protein Co-methyltransferase
MRANYIQYGSPQFRILSDKQIEELHFATLQILERTGVVFESQEAIDLLGQAGADVSNSERVKIPPDMVERALRVAPKMVTFYTREGEPAFVLNGQTGSHFGSFPDCVYFLDPYTGKRRDCYIEDIDDTARVLDSLPNIEWTYLATGHKTVPGAIADKISLLHFILNSSKPVIAEINDAGSLKEMIDLCAIIAGGEEQLRKKPFFGGSSEPVSPLIQGKDAMEKSLLCAEKGIPNVVYGMPMAGATTPATFAGCLAIANAEVLSQLVVLQLKNPGAPVIFGSITSIMDMKTTIFSYGAPEMSLMVGALTDLSHYYKLPMWGTAGCTDAGVVDAQAATELTFSILVSALSGADLVHDVALMYHGTTISPECMVLADEIIEMTKVLMGGIEINEETLPLQLIEKLGPKGNYLMENHTFKHFRKFWVPKVFDRSMSKKERDKGCTELLKERTLDIMKTYQPKPLAEDLVRELKKVEKGWFERVGLKHEYPRRDIKGGGKM